MHRVIVPSMNFQTRRSGKLEVHLVIEKGEGLKWGVAPVAFGQAVLARGSVESHGPGKGAVRLMKV